MNILLTISYDGSKYCGWQRQKEVATVQGEIENSLYKLFNKEIKIMGASRTDAGVHALDQKANFYIETNIPIHKLPYVINNFLPKDIVIKEAILVNDNFNAQFNVKDKTYRYKIYNDKFPNPMLNNYVWHLKNEIDINLMIEASNYIIGTHDFTSFCASGSERKSNIRTINYINIYKKDNIIYFDINSNGFLYNMVRIIVGTFFYVGIKKIKCENIKNILEALDRNLAGKTAPAKGLTLININYK